MEELILIQFLGVADDKGPIQMLRILESTVKLVGYIFSFHNTSHIIIFSPSETCIRYASYNTETTSDHNFFRGIADLFISIQNIYKFSVYHTTPMYIKNVDIAFSNGTYIKNVLRYCKG